MGWDLSILAVARRAEWLRLRAEFWATLAFLLSNSRSAFLVSCFSDKLPQNLGGGNAG